jgi:hypothetical protein
MASQDQGRTSLSRDQAYVEETSRYRPVDSVSRVLDWDPNDPDTVKVHYDVSSWNLEQRAELSAALADEEITHTWAGEELVVPEELEARTDELFSRLDEELGPFPIGLAVEEEAVEYGLDEWPDEDRETLTSALVEGRVAHRWEGATVLVSAESEATVDELLDGIEAGTVVAGTAPPDDVLPRLFAAADRLAKDADDGVGREELAMLVPGCDPAHPPYGLAKNVWRGVVESSGRLAAATESAESSDVIGAAQHLRSLLRPYV